MVGQLKKNYFIIESLYRYQVKGFIMNDGLMNLNDLMADLESLHGELEDTLSRIPNYNKK